MTERRDKEVDLESTTDKTGGRIESGGASVEGEIESGGFESDKFVIQETGYRGHE